VQDDPDWWQDWDVQDGVELCGKVFRLFDEQRNSTIAEVNDGRVTLSGFR
jgi:hypothetical protein